MYMSYCTRTLDPHEPVKEDIVTRSLMMKNYF